MEAGLAGPLSLPRIAAAAGLGPAHFARRFETGLGVAPHRHFLRLRLERAKRLLRETGRSVAQAAFECGLSHQEHMTRLFGRLVGATPAAYRHAARGRRAQDAARMPANMEARKAATPEAAEQREGLRRAIAAKGRDRDGTGTGGGDRPGGDSPPARGRAPGATRGRVLGGLVSVRRRAAPCSARRRVQRRTEPRRMNRRPLPSLAPARFSRPA